MQNVRARGGGRGSEPLAFCRILRLEKLFYIGSGAIRQGGNLERPQREPVCRKDESDIALEKPELCCCIVVLRRTVLLTFPSPCRFS